MSLDPRYGRDLLFGLATQLQGDDLARPLAHAAPVPALRAPILERQRRRSAPAALESVAMPSLYLAVRGCHSRREIPTRSPKASPRSLREGMGMMWLYRQGTGNSPRLERRRIRRGDCRAAIGVSWRQMATLRFADRGTAFIARNSSQFLVIRGGPDLPRNMDMFSTAPRIVL